MRSTIVHWLVIAAAALSAIAAIIHVIVMPEHFAEWWGYGAFFLVAASAQAVYALLLLLGPRTDRLLWAGIIGNLAIIVLWAVTRTIGIPFFGPHAGEVEEIGAIDVVSKIVEALLIATLAVLLREDPLPQRGFGSRREAPRRLAGGHSA